MHVVGQICAACPKTRAARIIAEETCQDWLPKPTKPCFGGRCLQHLQRHVIVVVVVVDVAIVQVDVGVTRSLRRGRPVIVGLPAGRRIASSLFVVLQRSGRTLPYRTNIAARSHRAATLIRRINTDHLCWYYDFLILATLPCVSIISANFSQDRRCFFALFFDGIHSTLPWLISNFPSNEPSDLMSNLISCDNTNFSGILNEISWVAISNLLKL